MRYLNSLAEECSRLIASFIKGLKGSKFSGSQYKKPIPPAIDPWLLEEMKKHGMKLPES